MKLIQVTLGAAATPIIAPSSTQTPTQNQIAFQQLIIQNNAAHACRVGDQSVSATMGIVIAAGGTLTTPALVIAPPLEYSSDLAEYYLFGTAGDLIDVMYVA